jgi:hypothetical protein
MLVDHLVYYLIHQDGMQWRAADYKARAVVKCVKNEEFRGTFQTRLSGREGQYSFATRQKFLSALWPHMANRICAVLNNKRAAIVPVPNSDATVKSTGEYKTLKYARAIADSSGGKLTAIDALRWQTAQNPQHKVKGRRDPGVRFSNLRLIENPQTPVILFDDFFTSGASLIAANWRLQEADATPLRAFVIGRQTDTQETKMTEWGSEELDIPQKPLF